MHRIVPSSPSGRRPAATVPAAAPRADGAAVSALTPLAAVLAAPAATGGS